ncbi:PREDICTED: spermatogenesis-associated protein 19, mitochondrial [Gavialis gangeticus]|uniref:spermatogenesis-associated protein 19, mitochondrial n=1 Tax=Gavialis gangeticus TaxID=94835 RepID=UPI00092F1483|nr:PREDICTED: spermatogenesis-associated protein 19, mitochondrial [Gavialis gangeticus]
MIISLWTTYIVARKVAGFPLPACKTQGTEVMEMETVSVLEHWLRKIEEEASKIFKQKLEGKAETRSETRSENGTENRMGPADTGTTRSQMVQVSNTRLPELAASNQSLSEGRTKVQLIRWSRTQVYRVSSDVREEAMQERLDQIRNSVSQLMIQAMQDNLSNTDIRATLSS